MKKKLLVIDDDQKLNSLLKEYLSRFDFEVQAVTHPDKALQVLKRSQPDIIILDVMLPDTDGFELCRIIRKSWNIPIIMLTARGDVTDRVVGLELGADDYLPKPFEPRELVARIQAVLRRGVADKPTGILKCRELTIDFDRRVVSLQGKNLDLTTAEFELLAFFVRNPGKVLTRDRIMEEIRGLDWEAFDRSVDVLVSRLRQKIGDDPRQALYIKTIWGTGYRFIGGESGK